MTNQMVPYPDENFIERAKQFQGEIRRKILNLSKQKTPKYSRSGQAIIRRRDDGYDYIIEVWIRDGLDRHFPGWSWVEASPIQFLGGEWVTISAYLEIVDPNLLYMGIFPPVRRFYSPASNRIQYKTGKPHTAENLVDLDNAVGGCNSRALKRGVNRLLRIGDDVYKKRLDAEDEAWEGNAEDVIKAGAGSLQLMDEVLKKHKIKWDTAKAMPGFEDLIEQNDYQAAYQILINYGMIV